MKMVVNSNETLASAIGELKSVFHKKKYLRLEIRTGRDRSLDQNALFHAWIAELVQKGGEMTFDEYRNLCRLHYFIPVLIRDNESFRELWFKLFPRENRTEITYKTQLELVGTITGITSICTTEQFSEALEEMQRAYASRITDPVFLEFPEVS